MQIVAPSFNRLEVIESHKRALDTRVITSVVPEATEVDVECRALQCAAAKISVASPDNKSQIFTAKNNLMDGVVLDFINNSFDVSQAPISLTKSQISGIYDLAETILPINSHFCNWFGLEADTRLKPIITLLSGYFTGKTQADLGRHFDYNAKIPAVSYKIYYDGNPEHSSLYYPGNYRIPHKLTRVSRAIINHSYPDKPTRTFNIKEEVVHLMPAKKVVMEPWNAYHSGPTSLGAIGTRRGMLVVTYPVS